MNENYHQPEMPEGVEGGILKGMYLYQQGADNGADKVQLMGRGTILRETIEAAEMLKNDFGIESDIWSIPGINQLKRDGDECERWNMLHPEQVPRTPYISELLEGRKGPVIAATDYKKTYAEQLRPFIKDRAYKVLGTDGFGRSDTRAKLREFFEVDRNYIVIAALKALHEEQRLPAAVVSEAIEKYSINADKPNPAHS
jgi:pyruvate dehydrogenase E1 component